MTQQSISSIPDAAGIRPFLGKVRVSVVTLLSDLPEAVRKFCREQPQWLWIIAPLAVLLIYTYAETWDSWFGFDRLLMFQPFVPFAVAYFIWRDREPLKEHYDLEMEPYLPDSPKRHGKLLPMFLSCLVLLAGVMTTWTTLAMVGLVMLMVSCVYVFFGGYALRITLPTLCYLLLSIPPPMVVITWITHWLQNVSTLLAGQILQIFVHDVRVQGTFIYLSNYQLEVSSPCSGITILFPVLALTAFLALYMRMHLSWSGILLVVGAGIAMSMNVVRIVVMGLLGGYNPDWATRLHDSNSLIFAILSFYLTFLVASRIMRGPRRRLSEFERDLADAARYDGYADGQEQAR